MDYLRSCYSSEMRLFRDRPDILVRGRWRWCPPGAIVVPHQHAFSSINWRDDKTDHGGVGEVRKVRAFSRGRPNPRILGLDSCGSAEVWLNGALYSQRGTPAHDEDGIPFCCKSGPAYPGGIGIDGDGAFDVLYPVVGSGGVKIDGVGSVFAGLIIVGQGGVKIDGVGELAFAGSGGVKIDGVGELAFAGSGGVKIDGVGELALRGSGGVKVDGGFNPGGTGGSNSGGLLFVGQGGVKIDGVGELALRGSRGTKVNGWFGGSGFVYKGQGGVKIDGDSNGLSWKGTMGASYEKWDFDRNEVTSSVWGTTSISGGSLTPIAGVDGTFQNSELTTGGGATGGAWMNFKGSSPLGNVCKLTANTSWTLTFRMYIPVLSVLAQRFKVQLGYMDTFTGSPNDGVWFEYSDSVNSGKWQGIAKKTASGTSTLNGTVAPVANTVSQLSLKVTGTSVEFFVDGVSIGSLSTNVPTLVVTPAFGILKSLGITAEKLVVDSVEQLILF